MSKNLCPSPELGKEDMDPNVINRMIIIGPNANVSESEIVGVMHMLDLPITIKSTCYGAMVSGYKDDVIKALNEVRKLDPTHIFTKERGFAPGDPRRCRGHRLGPREGFHQLEDEFRILGYVSEALENPEEVTIEEETPMDVDELKEIIKESMKN